MIDFAVVGGGLIGMLTARELALGGASVQILEKGELGRESSWAGGGILSPLYPWRYANAVTELARWSQRRYPELAETLATETGIDPEWTPNGLLMLDIVASEERDAAVDWAVSYDYELEILDPKATHQCEPRLGDIPGPSLWMPKVAQIRNPRLLRAMRRSLESMGVVIREHSPVTAIATGGGRAAGVHTPEGLLKAGKVVVAGGAWTAGLVQGLGSAIEVEPVRGQMLLFQGPPDLVSRIVLSRSRYIIPRRDGRVLVGSTLERAGFDKVTTEEGLADLKAAAFRLVPALRDLPLERHWAGLRPGSPKGIPYIGEHPRLPGLFVNAGHFRNGVVMGLASARLLADLALGRPPSLDPGSYAINRGA